jgi:hypothetical protein
MPCCLTQAGKSRVQAYTQQAPRPIAVCPHSSKPESRMNSRMSGVAASGEMAPTTALPG